jgi:SAM-dependent methyltransferase
MTLHVNHRFMLHFASQHAGKILDYGCGSGEVVRVGLEQNLDMYGCETFFEGAHGQREQMPDLLGSRILEMRDGRIPFSVCHFDCILSNQVFEHVQNIDLALSEIRRTLKYNGHFLCMFPTREVWREGHCGVPFAHRFSGSRLGYYWLLAFRCLGAGYFTQGKTRRQWAADFQRWLNSYCFYRPLPHIEAAFARHGFQIKRDEQSYIRFRKLPLCPPWLLNRLGFVVIHASKLS